MIPSINISGICTILLLLLVAAGPTGFGGEVLYEDAFANLDPSWGTTGDILSVNEGRLILKPPPNTSQPVLNQSHVFGDAEIAVEVMASDGDTGASGGLIFWAKDYSDFYCLCIRANGLFSIRRYVGDRWLKPVDWKESEAINKGIGQVNKLRVITASGQVTAYINDLQIVTLNGQAPRGGGCIGIWGTSTAGSQTIWQFANLRVIATSKAAPSPPPIPSTSPQPRRPVALRLRSSGTIGTEFASALCKDFLEHEGAKSVQRKPGTSGDEMELEAVLPAEPANPVVFEIRTHGSKTAFEDLATDACDVAMSSRRITDEEAERCARAGLGNLFSSECDHVFGLEWRRLYLYTSGNPQNKWTIRFIEFVCPKLEVFSLWTSRRESAALEALINAYQKVYPDVPVVNANDASATGSAAREVLQTRLAANNPPDTWQPHAGWELLHQYVEPGYCEPITELYDSAGWDKVFPRSLLDLVTKDGNIYAVVPGVHRGNVLWYNKRLLDRYRIHIADPMTFDEFFTACDKLKKAGISALGVGDLESWASAQVFENTLLGAIGPQGWTDLFNGRMRWDDPKIIKAMRYFLRMQRYLNADHSSLTWDQAVKKLMDGKVAFSLMTDWAYGEFIKANLQAGVDFGWVCSPSSPGTNRSFMLVTDGFTLAKGAPHKEAAIAWLKSIASKEAQEAFSAREGCIPARTDVDRSRLDLYRQWSMTDFGRDQLVPSCVHGLAAPEAFKRALNDAVASFVADKDKNVYSFAAKLEQAAKKVR
jgi:glucose/mannose transport system substrate-binding protein